MNETRDVKIVYRRSTILIPIVIFVLGIILVGLGIFNPLLGLFGGILVFIGVLTLGIVLVMVISLEASSRALRKQRPIPPPLSEVLSPPEKDEPHQQEEPLET